MDGSAVIYCEGLFQTDYGKTAHGLVRHTDRYEVLAVIDSKLAGRDAGEFLDGKPAGIPILATLEDALELQPDYFVIGMAPDGGVLPDTAREVLIDAMRNGLNVDSGLHEYLGDDTEFATIARAMNIVIRDVRRPPPREELHFFSGEIRNVRAKRVAVLGTDFLAPEHHRSDEEEDDGGSDGSDDDSGSVGAGFGHGFLGFGRLGYR